MREQALRHLAAPFQPEAVARAYGHGRKHFQERASFVVSNSGEVLEGPSGQMQKRKLVWAFPGQGSQLWGMGRDLHAQDALFQQIFDELNLRIMTLSGLDIKAAYWYSPKAPITNTRVSQLGLFAIGYALGQSLLQRGIKPDALLGHSVGEWVAATLSGLFTLDDAIRIINRRGALMEQMPKGSMLSVRSGLKEAWILKPADVDLAASNASSQQVFSGPEASIEVFAAELSKSQIASRKLDAQHAFHSWMVDPICAALEDELQKVPWQAMQIPIISSVHGDTLSLAEAQDPHYWSSHARVPVEFHKAIQTIAKLGDVVLVELGPRSVLTKLSRHELSKNSRLLPALSEGQEGKAFGLVLAEMWMNGFCLSETLLGSTSHERRPGVVYEFASDPAWIEATAKGESKGVNPSLVETSAQAVVQGDKRSSGIGIRQLSQDIRSLIEESSGEHIAQENDSTHFTELGLDSLFLTQLSLRLRSRFQLEISFRQLMEDLSSVAAIASYIDANHRQSESNEVISGSERKRSGLATEGKDELYFTDFGAKPVPSDARAKLGVDAQGQAAWFIPDEDRPGHYKQLLTS